MAVGFDKKMADGGLVTVPAVERSLAILERIADSNQGLTLSELSKVLGLPKNAIFRITNTLRAEGYVVRDERSMRFTLTSKLGRLASGPLETRDLIEVSFGEMRTLRDQTGETVQIGRRIGSEGVVLAHVESTQPLRISVDAGLRFPLYNNAPGKMLLATLPVVERDRLIGEIDLIKCTDRTILKREELRKECDRVLSRGYATDCAEADEGIHCVAAAIRDSQGITIGTVWVSAPSRRLRKSDFTQVGPSVMSAAERISLKLQETRR